MWKWIDSDNQYNYVKIQDAMNHFFPLPLLPPQTKILTTFFSVSFKDSILSN